MPCHSPAEDNGRLLIDDLSAEHPSRRVSERGGARPRLDGTLQPETRCFTLFRKYLIVPRPLQCDGVLETFQSAVRNDDESRSVLVNGIRLDHDHQ